jgi:23S rRNA (adenine2503-C2)-methyltransferase
MEKKINIRNLSLSELQTAFVDLGEKAFRAKQVYEWLWKKNTGDFNEMSNLSVSLREKLETSFYIDKIKLDDQQISSDKTIKCAFEVEPNKVVEGVLIPTSSRTTACISSQVGCSLACTFCATGKLKLLRNLTAGEIVDQVVYLKNQAESRYGQSLTNIVYMGMGEPLLNYKNVLRSTELLTSEEGLGMSPKRITVSTAGIAKMIKQLGDDEVKFNLALSLHAANDEKRNQIIPLNEKYSIHKILEAFKQKSFAPNEMLVFEYLVIRDFNHFEEDAQEIAKLLQGHKAVVNLIFFNPFPQAKFERPSDEQMLQFKQYLTQNGVYAFIRKTKGDDILAACGQLNHFNQNKKSELSAPSVSS